MLMQFRYCIQRIRVTTKNRNQDQRCVALYNLWNHWLLEKSGNWIPWALKRPLHKHVLFTSGAC